MEDENGSHTIKNRRFNLKLKGKTICSKAFASLHGVSHNTICNFVSEENTVNVEVADAVSFSAILYCYYYRIFLLRKLKKVKLLCFWNLWFKNIQSL